MDGPPVSVVVPLYNYAPYIGDCLRSILMQKYSPLEVIVVDDKSTDDSLKRARQFEDRGVRIIDLPRNVGFPASKISVSRRRPAITS